MLEQHNEKKSFFDIALVLLKQGKYEEAIKEYTKIIEIDPQLAAAYGGRGTAYQQLNQYQEAIQDYTNAIKINPQYAAAYYNRGIAYKELKKYEEAIQDYTNAIEINPQNAAAYYNRGSVYGELNQYEVAIQDYTNAIKIDPQDAIAYSNRGSAYGELKKYEEAIQDYTNAIKINPQYATAYYKRGKTNHELKKYEEAILDFTNAIKINPQLAVAYNNRGLAYDELKKYEEAILDYTNAIEIDPQDMIAYFNRGMAYKQLKKNEEAIQNFTTTIEINPQYAAAYFNRGMAYKQSKKNEEAIQDFTNTIKIDPQLAVAYFNRGNAYGELKKYEEAIYNYTGAINIDSQFAVAYFNRGIAYGELKKYELAIQDFISQLKIQPDNPLIHSSLGFIYYTLKELPKSREYLFNAQELLKTLTPMDLVQFNLSEGHLNYINKTISLLTEIDQELQRIKEQVTVQRRRKSISQEEEKDFFQQIKSIEDKTSKAAEQNIKSDTSVEQNQIIQMLQAQKQEIDKLKQALEKNQQQITVLENNQIQYQKDIAKLKQHDPFVIQQELEVLQQPNNANQYLYYKSLFWRLYNYLHAMSLISSNLFQINSDSMIESKSEKVLDYVKKAVKWVGVILNPVAVVGDIFAIINEALDFLVQSKKEQKFQTRMISLNNILQKFAVTPTDLEREIQFGAFNLIKSQNFNIEPQKNEILQKYINELSNLENNFEKQSKNLYWQLGIKHAIIILNYLEINSEKITNETSPMKLRDLVLNSVNIYSSQLQLATNKKEENSKQEEIINRSGCCQLF